MTGAIVPSTNPANYNTLSGAFNEVLNAFLNSTDDMLPATVVSYNRATNRATVQPSIQMQATNGQIITRARIASVPVFQFGGGGFVISMPLNAGDKGWIKSNDRDISLFMQGFNQAPPNTEFFHSFSNSVFIPAVLTGYVLASEDASNLVIQSLDGTEKLAFWQNFIKMITKGFGIGGTPAAGAILDVQSTTKAFAPPRMTTTQKNAIAAQEGFVVYDLNEHALSVYNGSTWS